MKIGIIGTGNMGRALGVSFARAGHTVFFGARDESKAADAAALAGGISQSGSLEQASRFGDLLLWTLREVDPAKILPDASLLNGKIIMDLNNRDYANEARTGAWFLESIAEQLQANVPQAHVVKAFNTLAMEAFDIPADELRAAGAQTFLAGHDQAAKRAVAEVARDLGLESIDVGSGPAAFRAVEALGDVIRLLMIDAKRGSTAHLRLISLPDTKLGAIGERSRSGYA